MKKLFILLLSMYSAYAYSQSANFVIYSNADSAKIIIDNKEVGFAMKNSPFTIPVDPGDHTLKAVWKNKSLDGGVIKIKKKQSLSIDVTFSNVPEHVNANDSLEVPTYLVVEEPAMFQGGDLSVFNLWVLQNLQYPKEAVENGISGKVFVQFIVNEKGNIESPKIIRSVNPILDNEAIRVISASPGWSPPRHKGVYVKQIFTLPIVFQME